MLVGDHAVGADPLDAKRIEVLRGAAALAYGGNAVGGVVNARGCVEPAPAPDDAPLPADSPRATTLVRSSPESWAESDLEQRPMRFDGTRLYANDDFEVMPDIEAMRPTLDIAGWDMQPGDAITSADTPWGSLRLSVCYDLRFPELYRQAPAPVLISVPAAFTHTTGQAHWELLLRARAVENLAFVIAPGQGGVHPGGKRTFGHSMIIDPWGQVLACHAAGEGMAVATLDTHRQQTWRTRLPALQHRRFTSPSFIATQEKP